jgi:hypothetical protein
MDTLKTVSAVPLAAADAQHDRSYVDWGAIAAGTVIASAITLVLAGFGASLGLSLTSLSGTGMSGVGLSIAAGLWVLWVAITSMVAGSYVTGRMRRRAGDANEQEVIVRDGAHGLVVWALSAIVGAMLAASAVSGIAKTGAEIARTATSAVSTVAGASSDYAIDVLTRSETSATPLDEATKQQIGRILSRSVVDGQINADDRAYLTRTIAARSGIAQAEVERRIDSTVAQAKATAERARLAAETARRIGVLIAFLTAAAMAIAAAAAWWGAGVGGRHRDENVDLSHFTRW